jgi:hypothetical protein
MTSSEFFTASKPPLAALTTSYRFFAYSMPPPLKGEILALLSALFGASGSLVVCVLRGSQLCHRLMVAATA